VWQNLLYERRGFHEQENDNHRQHTGNLILVGYIILGASKRLYIRLCPSICWFVCLLVRLSVRPHITLNAFFSAVCGRIDLKFGGDLHVDLLFQYLLFFVSQHNSVWLTIVLIGSDVVCLLLSVRVAFLQIISKLLHFFVFRFEIWHTPSRTHCPEVFLDLAL
jgi:hypothetical protein